MALTDDDKKWIKGAITEGVVDALNEVVLPKFDEIDERLDGIDRRLDGIDERLDGIDERLNSRDQQFMSINSRLNSLEVSMRELKEETADLSGQIEALTNDIKTVYDEIYGKPNKILISKSFLRLPDDEKLLVINDVLVGMANKIGVELPR